MKKIFLLTVIIFFSFLSFLSAQQNTSSDLNKKDKLITLDVKEIDIADVIRMIADQSGLNIITSKNVQGVISINLQNIPVETALESILKVNNCVYVKDDDIIQVYTIAEIKQKEQFAPFITRVFSPEFTKASDLKPLLTSLKSALGKLEIEPRTNRIVVTDTEESIKTIEQAIRSMDKKLETKIYKINYARPQDLQKSLLSILPATDGDILADERTNSLVVTASPMLLNKIDVLIHNWDKQIPQVLIEAKIMQVTLEKSRMLGVDWQYQNPDAYSVTIGAKDLPIPSGASYLEALKVGVLSADDFQVTIRALEGLNDANLISSPSIVTLDSQEAKILIGSNEPYEFLYYDKEGHVTGREIKFMEVGIKLAVTPKITEDGFITMNIHPEVSTPRTGTALAALAVDTTEATTVMTVKDGNTVVLGGLIKDDKEKKVSKLPFLGDIPLLKYLFRNEYTKNVKKEIVIFITPHIINSYSNTSAVKNSGFSPIREKAMQKALEGIK